MVAGTAVDVAEENADQVLQDGRTVDSLTAIVDRVFLEVGGAVGPGRRACCGGAHVAGIWDAAGVATNDNTASAEAALTRLGLHSAFCFVCGYDAGLGQARPRNGVGIL